MGEKLEQALAVLNGLVGDYLARQGNGLATEMACYRGGARVVMERASIERAVPDSTPRVALLVHGLMCRETIWRFPDGSDYGQKLRAELGITPFYLRYNTGLPLVENGAALAAVLRSLCAAYPVPIQELILIGYSMGGLLVRSACHFAAERGHTWLSHVGRAIYVGTPHLGTPAERVGRMAAKVLRAIPDPYTRLIGQIGDLRSAGIQDLGDGDLRDARHPLPLLPGIRHALVAGSLAADPGIAALFGDSLVPVGSAIPDSLVPESVQVLPGRSHLDLPHDEEVYAFIRRFCAP